MFGKQNFIDSLNSVLQSNSLPDTARAKTLNLLSREYVKKSNYVSAMQCAREVLSLSGSLISLKGRNEVSTAYNNLGNIYTNQGNYPEALKNYFEALKIDEKSLKESLENSNQPGDEIWKIKQGIASSYNNLGVVYWKQENHEEALKNYLAALKIKEELGDKRGIAMAYNNMGIIHYSKRNYPEALKNYSYSLKIFEETANKRGISYSLECIALVHFEKKEFSLALEKYKRALEIALETGDKVVAGSTYINVSNILIEQKKFDEAAVYLSKGLNLSREINSLEAIKESYQSLAKLDSARGNFRGAFENFKYFSIFKDSLFNEENTKKSVQAEMLYEFDKKELVTKAEQEKKDSIALAESKRKNLFILFIAAVALAIASIAIIIFRTLRITRKQKHIIELAKNQISEQKKKVEEHQKEIIDSITYAKRIQFALLAHDNLLKNNLPEHFVMFRPKDIVSGDFYWATKKENRFYLAVCDSTGHGVPGAFMSLLNISFLNEAINEKGIIKPNEILNHVRLRLIENISQEGARDGMDAILCKWEIQNGKWNMEYSAANSAPVLIQDGKIIELPFDKMPVGQGEKKDSFNLHTLDLHSYNPQGTPTIYFFTDGFADQFGGPKGKKFKYKQLEEKLSAINRFPIPQQKIMLEKMFLEWKGDLEQVDDVTLIGVRV